jgi:hypothetical protein
MLRTARTRRKKSKNFWGARAECSEEPTIRVGGLARTKRSNSNVVSHPTFFCVCELIQGVLKLHTQHLPRRRDVVRLGRLGLEARANESSQLFFITRRGE